MTRVSAPILALALLAGCPPGEVDPLEGCDPGVVCVLAGNGETGFSGDGEQARDAAFYRPTDVSWRPGTDEYYIVDWNNHMVRRVGADGIIERVIGDIMPGDGPVDLSDRQEPGADGTTVALNHPVQVEWGPDGLLYLPNWHNHKVRTWNPDTGKMLVIAANTGVDDGNGANAGFAGDGGPAEDALLAFPNSMAFAPGGEYVFVDQKNLRVRSVGTDDVINTIAGAGTLGFTGDGGDPMLATFAFVDVATNPQPEPAGAIEIGDDGMIYVADSWNHCIRQIDLESGVISAVAGTGTAGYDGDGGNAMLAQLSRPTDIELGPDGRLYVMDQGNFVVRAIDLSTGAIETVLGTGEDGAGEPGQDPLDTEIGKAFGIDFADDGSLLVADSWNNRILMVKP
jgi:hypothetical protein